MSRQIYESADRRKFKNRQTIEQTYEWKNRQTDVQTHEWNNRQ